MAEYKLYRKKESQPMRPYIPGEDLSKLAINPSDFPPVEGGMIAQAINDVEDIWYINPAFFKANYIEE